MFACDDFMHLEGGCDDDIHGAWYSTFEYSNIGFTASSSKTSEHTFKRKQ